LRFDLAHEHRQVLQVIAARGILDDLERARVAVVDQKVVGPNDHFELEPLRQIDWRGIIGRKIQLQNVRLGKHRGKDQEKHQNHHHVDHRHDVQIVAPLVIAGVIASDEARGF
jgi:hypothetical protein